MVSSCPSFLPCTPDSLYTPKQSQFKKTKQNKTWCSLIINLLFLYVFSACCFWVDPDETASTLSERVWPLEIKWLINLCSSTEHSLSMVYSCWSQTLSNKPTFYQTTLLIFILCFSCSACNESVDNGNVKDFWGLQLHLTILFRENPSYWKWMQN